MNKQEKYRLLAAQMESLLAGETSQTALLANAAAAIHETLGTFWTGFYLVEGDTLVLGPFQGPVACYRIPRGRGVCGLAWQERRTLVVPDVEQFPGHIACSSLSRSEIVVPLETADGRIVGVLDIDSRELASFDEIDARGLESLCRIIVRAAFPTKPTAAQ